MAVLSVTWKALPGACELVAERQKVLSEERVYWKVVVSLFLREEVSVG